LDPNFVYKKPLGTILKMKYQSRVLIVLILLLISCQQNGLNQERILKIGKELTQTDFNETDSTQATDIVMLGTGLKEEMIELQKNSTKFDFNITKGYLEKPIGDNQADAVLTIISDYKNIGIRMKYDKAKDKYHILGWKTLSDAPFRISTE